MKRKVPVSVRRGGHRNTRPRHYVHDLPSPSTRETIAGRFARAAAWMCGQNGFPSARARVEADVTLGH